MGKWMAWAAWLACSSTAMAGQIGPGTMPREVRSEIERIAGMDVLRLVGALTGRDSDAMVKLITYLNRRGTRPLIDEMETIARYDRESCGSAPSERAECEAGPSTDSRERVEEVRRLAKISTADRKQVLDRVYLATLVLAQEVTSEVLSKSALASATACREGHEPQCTMLSERVTISWAWIEDLVHLARARAAAHEDQALLSDLQSKIIGRVMPPVPPPNAVTDGEKATE